MSEPGEVGLRADGLSVSFDARRALVDVSFEVPRATFAGVLGPNGAGKTTLLRALLGALPHAGSKWIGGRPAYVPQAGAVDNAFPIDALGVVLMGRYPRLGWRRRPGRADRHRALEILDAVGLAGEARSPFGTLSSGQRQRTLVGRALAQEGDVLLLDEPLTGVDTPSQEVILGVLDGERRRGRTLLMTTHDLGQAARVCDLLLVLNETLVAVGPPEEVFRPEVLGRAYGHELLLLGGYTALVDDAAHHSAP
ncbi:MAG: metal ABC transporter ATP-binding protein [Thermoleophilaceae bacterium]|jgi:ABC-type Mn2+/Zn2+ transport system ATPase subunit|nr:metal ABC transporter ATP-binding protein [Thermoleophilaceae bacterium]